jgi:hypothetical protein
VYIFILGEKGKKKKEKKRELKTQKSAIPPTT